MILDEEQNKESDKLIKQKYGDKNILETFVYSLKNQRDKISHKLLESELFEITKIILNGINYVESELTDYSGKFKELEEKIFIYSEKIWSEK